ncbi:MFS transporter [Lactiplantibacillus daowaiensis]|uniref:MFS transporter n=1 Tax=Lactiplantibacillus daowaiensis TaxID=2559918 RepID=A0ABW1RZB4_9LACO|nr:MFS transporter [Lactiplantibacillus daowaiensis]
MLIKATTRNLHRGYTYTALAYFGITSLWVIFLQQRGLSLVQIGLCESIFHLTSFLSEVPSGILADRFSYRTMLISGRIAAAIHAIIMLTAHSFWWFALGFVVQAWAYNLQSGTLEALFYESLVDGQQTKRYPQVTSNMNTIIELADTSGVLVAGWLIHGYLAATYWGYLLLAVLTIVVILGLHEPTAHAKHAQQLTLWQILKAAVTWLHRLPKLAYLMGFHALFSAIGTTYYYYFQAVMTTHGFHGSLISGILIAVALLNVGAVQLTPRLQQRWSSRNLLVGLTGLLIGALILTGIGQITLLVGGYLFINMLMAVIEPLMSNYYNALIPSAQRATLLSISSMAFSIVMIVMFPLIGWLIEQLGFAATFSWLGLLLLLVGGVAVKSNH